ncbi:MAG: AAA family ATPase [Kofleriaceae bacterium]
MSLFVGRKHETAELLALRRKRSASLVVLKGRRRIGKSTFVNQCAKHFDHFLAFEGLAPRTGLTAREQLEAFAVQLAQQTSLPKVALDNWSQALQLLGSVIPGKGSTLVLLDEISWMSIGDRDFAGHLKTAWDRHLSKHPRLIVVLCGSVSSWIERNILASPGFVGRLSLNLTLEPLPLTDCNAFWRGRRATASEKLKILAVTGGVPRYLEEIDPSHGAEHNVHRLCFEPGGLLFREADQIFHDVFDRRADTYRRVLSTLVDGSRTVSEIGAKLKHGRGGSLSVALEELVAAGFLRRDISFAPRTGQSHARAIRYRLSDNYLRFYLKYVEPRRAQIEKKLYREAPLDSLIAWDTIFGLQVENLVLQSFDALRPALGLERVEVINAGPYVQTKTNRREGCQVDLLVRTRRAVLVVEIKLRDVVDRAVIDEVRQKVARLEGTRGLTVRTGLIYVGELDPRIEAEDYFDFVVALEDLLGR